MPEEIESDGMRETDPLFVTETDNIFKAILKQAQLDIGKSPFFPKDNSPAVIDIHGTTDERLAQIGLYVTPEGSAYGEEQSILNIDEMAEMNSLISDQKEKLSSEKKQKFGLLDFNK